jgi:hypothetical protein
MENNEWPATEHISLFGSFIRKCWEAFSPPIAGLGADLVAMIKNI